MFGNLSEVEDFLKKKLWFLGHERLWSNIYERDVAATRGLNDLNPLECPSVVEDDSNNLITN